MLSPLEQAQLWLERRSRLLAIAPATSYPPELVYLEALPYKFSLLVRSLARGVSYPAETHIKG